MDWAVTALGALVVALTLRDIFHTLLHPSGESVITRVGSRLVWRTAARLGSRARDVAGPLLLVSVVLLWTALVVLGCALVYWRHLDDGFLFSPSIVPGRRSDLLDALYLSTVVTGTLGFGDIVAREGWLRMVTGVQGLLGFALLTAALSWVTQTRQTLVRRRALARFLQTCRRGSEGSAPGEPGAWLLHGLAHSLAAVHVELGQSPSTYYFRERDEGSALALSLPYAVDLVGRGRASLDPDRRHAAGALGVALDDFTDLLGKRFVAAGPCAEVLHRYAVDQGYADPD